MLKNFSKKRTSVYEENPVVIVSLYRELDKRRRTSIATKAVLPSLLEKY